MNPLAVVSGIADWVPDWTVSLITLVLAASLALLLHRTLLRSLRRAIGLQQLFLQSLVSRTYSPTRFALVLLAIAIALPLVPLSYGTAAAIARCLSVGFIILVGWSAAAAIALASEVYLRRANIGMESDAIARKHLTQVRMLRRIVTTLVVIVTTAAALMTFDSVRQYGVSLIASAGAAGLIVGLAARPLLANLIAGIQIALTQPIRIGDAVIVENEWGWIEEISSTYVVIKLWDWRRLVVPLSYFLEKPFQNWTRQSTEIIGTVQLWVDYAVPVDEVRRRLKEIAHHSDLWDRKVVNLQVTDASERSIALRALVSARTSPDAWDLRCEVREKLIGFLQERYPNCLPKQRTELLSSTNMANGSGAASGAAPWAGRHPTGSL